MNGLTKKQLATLRAVCSFIAHRGYPPSGRELARYMGGNLSATFQKLRALEDKGYLSRRAGALVVLKNPDDAKKCLLCGHAFDEV